jgi:hypothetical protein
MSWDSSPGDRARVARERAQAARTRATQVLVVSAGLAERHAEVAEANGDLERAKYERAVARRVWTTVERLRNDPASG